MLTNLILEAEMATETSQLHTISKLSAAHTCLFAL